MTKIEKLRERYLAAAHAVQTGIGALMAHAERYGNRLPRCEPKHLRAGIDLSKSDLGGLATLLIEKGVFTEAEYTAALTTAAETEATNYTNEVRLALGNPKLELK